ncbi:FAD-dependent oxidoreductase [bacterium 1XD42-8]|jgi:uncharacterized FAD-dependent dehydrogenase|nr:NAD(P)-binding protein [Lachnospiraceae bacterium]RKJ39719.1 FAD-dependent oxidoreductase [bacterium 1XD42-8]
MIRLKECRLPLEHGKKDIEKKIEKQLGISKKQIINYKIHKKSIDARKKPTLFVVYSIDVEIVGEEQYLARNTNKKVEKVRETLYSYPKQGKEKMKGRPIVIGSGPGGLFCAYLLAKTGYEPIVLEQGESIEKRKKTVEHFWKTGELNGESNVQFGEGGAGTFSDGKLNTLVNDTFGRNKYVLETFVKHGAPKHLLYEAKPHIGTDLLSTVIKNMREEIKRLGGTFFFETKAVDFYIEEDRIKGVVTKEEKTIWGDVVVLAVGHSARDTFYTLYERGLSMEAKSFAVGVRVEHPQSMIDESQYGRGQDKYLPAASYKLAAKVGNRGVYTFCMCPGGYVVNASSEEKRLAVNGMSYHNRRGKNANSAVIVAINPEDFPKGQGPKPLEGVLFQQKLEEKAYEEGGGVVPVQTFGDFLENRKSKGFGNFQTEMKGTYAFGNLRNIFPEGINEGIKEGMIAFGKKIKGFDNPNVILSGVESRTSSPVRMKRGEDGMSNIKGLYPCAEGAGYAGGIMSAAMDGMKIAEKIIERYKANKENEKDEHTGNHKGEKADCH